MKSVFITTKLKHACGRVSAFWEPDDSQYWLTRVVFLRFLGFIYFIAFFSLAKQLGPLIGSNGLLPANLYLERLETAYGSGLSSFLKVPTVFWADCSDPVLYAFCYVGVVLAVLLFCGFGNGILLVLIWFLYMSFVHIGQLFYGYGWEMLLLEVGFLAIFLRPPLRTGFLPLRAPPPKVVFWMLRWVLFRVMFGAGLIKLRGDECWRDLTCMVYHYETQPIPNPISWYLHQMPLWMHQAGVIWNHFIELIVPWLLFGPRIVRIIAGVLLVSFQLMLIISGNLSWLNWLTIAVCIACFDDKVLKFLFSKKFLAAYDHAKSIASSSWARKICLCVLTGLIAYLSIKPIQNLTSREQKMNSSFDRLHLVNTYGAFGHIGKKRYEIIMAGTTDKVASSSSKWLEYEFKCKPGDIYRRPILVAPFHYRVDWQIWFAAMQNYQTNPWLIHLVYKLLQNDEGALTLIDKNPFDKTSPPKLIRLELYEYEFTDFNDDTGAWWRRKRLGLYAPPLSLENPSFLKFIKSYGWLK